MGSPIVFFFALFFFTGSSIRCANGFLERYVSLISDVHQYYGTSSVFFISSKTKQRVEEYTLVHMLSREFSRKGVLSLITNIENLDKRVLRYSTKMVRPLVVVMITAIETIAGFTKYTEGLNISYPIWLVIFADEFGEPVCEYCNEPMINIFHLRFNTEMLVVCCQDPLLREWWAIHQNKTEMAVVGKWTQNDGFKLLVRHGLYARRQEINGTGLRIAIVKNSAFLESDGKDKFGGFFGTLLMELKRVMNFEIIAMIEEEGFGTWNSITQSWTGAMSHVVKGDADIGVAEFTITNRRLDVVDFTYPLILSRARLYIKEPDGLGIQWSAYFKAFTNEIWTAIVVLTVTTAILLTLIKMKAGHNSLAYIFFENQLYIWGIFCQQGLAEFPAETPLRIVYFSIFVTALIVSAAYSASLISFLTVSTVSMPFTTMEGFTEDGSYGLVVMQNSSDWDLFTTSVDPVLSKMKTLLRPWNSLPSNLIEAFKKVCKERVAFYSNDAMVNTITRHIPCKVIRIESDRTDSLAMIMSGESQYTGVVNYHIQRFQDNGMMQRLKQKYLIEPAPVESVHGVVNLWGVAPILSVLAGGIILSFIVLFFEKLRYSLRKSERNRRRVLLRKTKMHRWFNARGNHQRKSQMNLQSPFSWQTGHFGNSLIARHYP